ncbi:MAG: sodium/proline symporter PutP [Eubacteriales bacterium]|nr:sodium/proline symporter PutP [Eubacteriales bacterium]
MSQTIIMITIAVYLVMVVAIGFVFTKKNNTVDDFYLGGRKLGPFVTAMSAEASDMSSWLLMGLPGVAYLSGVADATWTALGLAIGTYVNWLIVAKRIRKYSQGYEAFTLPDFFSKRFGDNKNILTFISAIVIIVFFIPYTASGFAACGKLFSGLFGSDYLLSMIVSAVVIVTYCTLGGFLAASTTDLIQSIVMTIALFVVVGFGVETAGGFDAVISNAQSLPGYLDMFSSHVAASNGAKPYSLLSICSTLAWGLGYFGMPHILLRFMAIEDENKLKLSRRVATIWVVISLAVAVFIGIVGLGISKTGAIEMLTGSNSETIIMKITHLLSSNGAFAAVIAGVILAGILAATMSTADSQLLAAASSVSQNLFTDCFKIKLSQKKSMMIARVTVVIISIISIILASDPKSSVFDIVSFAWAGFGATFGPVVLAALFWKNANKYGAIAGLLTGGVTIFVWKYGISKIGGVFAIYELLPAFVAALVTIVVVSKLTGKPDKEVLDKFEEVRSA